MGSILTRKMGGTANPEAEDSSQSSRVVAFHSSKLWHKHFNSSKQLNKLAKRTESYWSIRLTNVTVYDQMVVDFTASWCAPCKFIAPVFAELSTKYTDVDFVKIDVDELADVAREFGVQVMPTFVFMKLGKQVGTVVGAEKDELEKMILKHRGSP